MGPEASENIAVKQAHAHMCREAEVGPGPRTPAECTSEELQKIWEGPASPGDMLVKALGWTEGETGYSRA